MKLKCIFCTLLGAMLSMLIQGCTKKTYLEVKNSAKFKIGDIIVIDEGYFKGCKVKVQKIVIKGTHLEYQGPSECAEKGQLIGVRE